MCPVIYYIHTHIIYHLYGERGILFNLYEEGNSYSCHNIGESQRDYAN
jgi:hypothetical protein